MIPLYHARLALAVRLADGLLGQDPFSDAPNGLFLAAPRRTGKSTFLQRDLQPELERRGCLVVYVDFWSQSRRDPAQVLMEALAVQIQRVQGVVGQLASVFSKIKLGGVEIDLSRVGQADGTSIPQVLALLSKEAGRAVVLILDEAQHTLTSEAGESAMFALKSARDQLNSPDHRRLLMVFSGSDRDKLLRLVNSANAPFFGSHVHRLPELDRAYVADIARGLEQVHPWLAPVDIDALDKAFETVGRRPQFLTRILEIILSRPPTTADQARAKIQEHAEHMQEDEAKERTQIYLGLKPLEQFVLWRMLEQGTAFRPYDADSKAFYSALNGKAVTTAMAQRALESLRAHNPPVVWKSARAEYAVEDTAMHGWFHQQKAANAWPPNENRQELLDRLQQVDASC